MNQRLSKESDLPKGRKGPFLGPIYVLLVTNLCFANNLKEDS